MQEAQPQDGLRESLSAAGQQQTQQLLVACHQLLEASGGSGSGDAAQLEQLQERYLSVAGALRQTLEQCRDLEEAAAAAAGASTSSASEEADPEVQQLRARAEELRLRLEEKNQLVKAAVDRLRALLDALCMWDSSRRELQAAAG